MNIDLSKMKRIWWEDIDGNVLDVPEDACLTDEQKEQYPFYNTCLPCQIQQVINHYGYHPKGIDKILIKLPFINKRVKERIGKTFKRLYTVTTTYGAGGDCIAAMVSSGHYTLEEAIWIYTTACERCTNALEYKYLNKKSGYSEYSSEWVMADTKCIFCAGEE